MNCFSKSPKKNNFFIKDLSNCSFINVCYELRCYERGVAQLGSAGALGASTLRT